MKYTYALHENRVKYLQDILDKLIALCSAHDFHPNKETFLASQKSGVQVEVRCWRPVPGGNILYAHLSWVAGSDISFLNIEFNNDTNRLNESTRWNANNEYLGGHIQFSHNYRGSEESFLQKALALLNDVSIWTRLPEDQSAFA